MKATKIIAANLDLYMTKENETQADLAEVLDVTQAAVSNYMTGKKAPSIDSLIKIAKHYGCSVDDLVTMNYRLKPCPFCGADAYVYEINNECTVKADHSDNCVFSKLFFEGKYNSKQEAVDSWNMRARENIR